MPFVEVHGRAIVRETGILDVRPGQVPCRDGHVSAERDYAVGSDEA